MCVTPLGATSWSPAGQEVKWWKDWCNVCGGEGGIVTEDDYISIRQPLGDYLQIGRSLNAGVNLVLANDGGGRLVEADVDVKCFEFWVATVYAPNITAERASFFCRLALLFDDSKRIILVGDWNASLDPKIDRVWRGATGSGRCESNLIDLMTRHDLVDMSCL